MATIANLGVSLTARTGNFEKGFKRAQKIAGRFAADVAGHVKTVASFGTAVAGAALGIGTYFVKQQLEAVDATSKLSRAIGIETENLIGLEHAGNLAGLGAEMIAKSVEQFTKRMGEARMQGGPLLTFLKDYDSTLLRAIQSSKSADAALALVADAIKNANDVNKEAVIANAAFGKSGIKMAEIFRDLGSNAIPLARKEMEKLGISFSAIDGKAVEEANDALTRIQTAVTGIARRVAIQLAPFIKVAADRFLEFAQSGNMGGEVVVNALMQIFTWVGKIADGIAFVESAWFTFVAGVRATGGIIAKSMSFIKNTMENGITSATAFLLSGVETNAMDEVAQSFFDKAAEAAERVNTAWGDFVNGSNAKAAQSFFNSMKADAEEFRATLEKGIVPDVGANLGGGTSTKTAEFRQVDLSRIAVGGPGAQGGVQKVQDPQLKTTNDLLRNISTRIGGSVLTA